MAGRVAMKNPPRRGSFVDEGTSTSPSLNGSSDISNAQIAMLASEAASASNRRRSPSIVGHDLDDDAMLTDDDVGFLKSAPASRRSSTTPLLTSGLRASVQQSSLSEGDVIEVRQGPYQLPLDQDSKPSGKLKNKYVLADGTVVNGKGLGRGRPGIKRGARKSTLSNEIIEDDSAQAINLSTPPLASQNRQAAGKRKRTDSYAEDDSVMEVSSRESTPEYNPGAVTHTRSGRQSQKPIVSTPAPAAMTANPAAKRPSLQQSASSPIVKKHPKIKAKVYRGREQFALCEHCLRGNGPPGNVIVFCDACNKCWHQRCHDPKISKEVVADTKADWYCSDCDRILHGKKKGRPPKPLPQPVPSQPMPSKASAEPTKPLQRYSQPYIPGMALSLTQRQEYLHSLDKDKIIEIVLRAADLAPNMPIFETPLHEAPRGIPPMQVPIPVPVHGLPQPRAPAQALPPRAPAVNVHIPGLSMSPSTATPPPRPPPKAVPPQTPVYDHPTAGIPSKPNMQPNPPAGIAAEDEGFYDDYDEMAMIYPKPGEGAYDLAMPPEKTDLDIMLEGPDNVSFSHWVQGRGEMKTTV